MDRLAFPKQQAISKLSGLIEKPFATLLKNLWVGWMVLLTWDASPVFSHLVGSSGPSALTCAHACAWRFPSWWLTLVGATRKLGLFFVIIRQPRLFPQQLFWKKCAKPLEARLWTHPVLFPPHSVGHRGHQAHHGFQRGWYPSASWQSELRTDCHQSATNR